MSFGPKTAAMDNSPGAAFPLKALICIECHRKASEIQIEFDSEQCCDKLPFIQGREALEFDSIVGMETGCVDSSQG